MTKNQMECLQALGLQASDLQGKPESVSVLQWLVNEKKASEEQVLQWASEHYQIPAVRPEFFDQELDSSLIARYSALYNWSETCFPINFSNGHLAVACLEPVTIENPSVPVFFVAAPHSCLKSAWESMSEQFPVIPRTNMLDNPLFKEDSAESPEDDFATQESQALPERNQPSPTAESPEIDFDFGDLATDSGASTPLETPAVSSPDPEEESDSTSLDSLDFSTIAEVNPEAATVVSSPQDQTTQVAAKNETRTAADPEINKLTSATSTQMTDAELSATLPDQTSMDSPVATTLVQDEEFDDEDTKPEIHIETSPDLDLAQNTLTQAPQATETPRENLISDGDILKNKDLNPKGDFKSVVAHMFNHLKKDFKHVMWVERDSEGAFFPKYVDDTWQMTKLSWQMHINLTNPNIFRIAYNSSMPFHGEINSNPHNQKYFEWWLSGETPDFATIYPVIINDVICGFVAGFNKNSEFDEVGSLKKVENLIAICERYFPDYSKQKAA